MQRCCQATRRLPVGEHHDESTQAGKNGPGGRRSGRVEGGQGEGVGPDA